MWFNYQSNQKGIAIQSTVNDLLASIDPYKIESDYEAETINVAKVKYIDYESQEMDTRYGFLTPFLYKRKNYAYENEVRFIISLRIAAEFGVKIPESGIAVAFDYNKGIKQLVLSPYADSAYKNDLQAILEKYQINFKIVESSMVKLPKY